LRGTGVAQLSTLAQCDCGMALRGWGYRRCCAGVAAELMSVPRRAPGAGISAARRGL
jgi:hypothetical protein